MLFLKFFLVLRLYWIPGIKVHIFWRSNSAFYIDHQIISYFQIINIFLLTRSYWHLTTILESSVSFQILGLRINRLYLDHKATSLVIYCVSGAHLMYSTDIWVVCCFNISDDAKGVGHPYFFIINFWSFILRELNRVIIQLLFLLNLILLLMDSLFIQSGSVHLLHFFLSGVLWWAELLRIIHILNIWTAVSEVVRLFWLILTVGLHVLLWIQQVALPRSLGLIWDIITFRYLILINLSSDNLIFSCWVHETTALV